MIKKSFQTIFNNKTILIGYAIITLAPLLITMPVNLGFSGYSAMNNSYDMHSSNYWLTYILSMTITLLTTLAVTIFGKSPLLHYIGEVCQGLDTKGWYKRGLKKCWWRQLVYGLICFGIGLVLLIGFGLLLAALPTAGIILVLLIPIFLAFSVITALGANIIIIEDDFGIGLGNIFRVGMKYSFKYLGALLLGILPSLAIYGIIAAIMFSNVNQMSALPMSSATDIYGGLGWVYWLMVAIMAIYNIIYMSFITTYGSHCYLAYRNKAYSVVQDDSNQIDMTETSTVVETEIQSETDNVPTDNDIKETTGEKND